ncbi:MAG: peptide ABC transporter substrate-binding protein [Lachnospiraceae bacterium]|nr:peptide ABC transporter substrate-binding protein [Lachnospiraceae bacterium]
MKRKGFMSMALSALLALTTLAGCGFTGNSGSSASQAPAAQSSEGAAAADTSAEASTESAAQTTASSDEVLSVPADAEIKTLVPWAASETQAFLVVNQAQEGLFRMDENNVPQPALCDTYTLSDDKLTYDFHLRDGIQWSNGDPITAEDFVYAWLKQMSADATNGYSFIMTDYIVNGQEYNEGKAKAEDVGVKAKDDSTLEVTLKNPTPYFLNLTTMIMFFPVQQKFCEAQGDKFDLTPDNMLFSGPYVITEYDPAVGVTFKKNDKYWDAANVKIENAKVRVMKDASAALNAYQANELSEVNLTSTDVAANKDNPEFLQRTDFRTNYIQFNLTDSVMSNANMRKAISMAIDRQTLVDTILADGSAAGTGLVADGMSGDGKKSFRELNGEVSPYDPEKAKEYYKKACDELGKTPDSVTLLIGDDSVMKTVATFIQSELQNNLGLKMEIDTKTMQGRGEQMDANNYQMGLTAWGADYDDAMTYLDLWTNGTPYRGNYNNDKYNALIKEAKTTTDTSKRLQDMLDAEKMLVEDDAVVAPVYFRGSAMLIKSNLKNLITHPIGVPMEFKYAYFE